MAVPLLDLKHQYKQIEAEVLPKIAELCESQEMILGPAVEQFEEEAGRYCGNVRTVGCSSGTDALLLALMALEIGPGDAVLTTPYTFFATAGCVRRLGIELLFADIDPLTYNISPQKIEETLSARCSKDSSGRLRTKNGNTLRAIIPVHLFGLCCDLDAIGEIAARHDLAVIEDAAQAIGAEYPSSKQTRTFRAGSYGAMGCFSFYPTKNLGAFGDAGLVTCLDPAHETRLRALRNHGMSERSSLHRWKLPARRPAGGGSVGEAAASGQLVRGATKKCAMVR
jgi:dTDP-4-amino-4,6-dideoxygalactose transaminase